MTFLFQLVAVLIAGSVVALAWTRSGSAIAVARAIGVLAAAFAYVAFWGHFWQLGRSFWDQRQAWQLVSPEQADVAGAPTEPGFQAGFAEWIRGKLEPGETFYLVPSPTRDEAVYQWFTFRLLPNFAS